MQKKSIEGLSLKKEPDLFIHGTTSTSRYSGAQSAALCGFFDYKIPSYETRAGCSTGLAGLHMGFNMMQSGSYNRVLFSFAEVLSNLISFDNLESWFGLADGATSLLIEKSKEEHADFKVVKSLFYVDGKHVDIYTTPGKLPPSKSASGANADFFLSGDPEALKVQALINYKILISELLTEDEKKGVTHIIPHQVNRALIKEVYEENQLSGDPYWVSQHFGNIGGTTIPCALTHGLENDIFKSGDKILLMSVGGGISAAAQLWEKL